MIAMKKHWVKIGSENLGDGLCELFVWDPEARQLLMALEDEFEDEELVWNVFAEAGSVEEATKKYHDHCDQLAQQIR